MSISRKIFFPFVDNRHKCSRIIASLCQVGCNLYSCSAEDANIRDNVASFVRFNVANSISIAFLILVVPNLALAAAWTAPKGRWLIKTEYQFYQSCQFWTQGNRLLPASCYTQEQVNPFIEFGATKRLTLGLNPFFRSIRQAMIKQSFNFDNSEVFGRYLLWHAGYSAFSIQFAVNIPFRSDTINADQFNPAIAAFALAQRQVYTDGRLLYGTGGVFNKQQGSHWYADFQVSYRQYYQGAANQVHIDLTQAWKARKDRVEITLKELTTFSVGNPSSVQEPNYDLLSIEPSLLVWNKSHYIGLQLGVLQDIYGRNVTKATTPFLSLWLSLG